MNKKLKLKYEEYIYLYCISDASATLRAGYNVPTALIVPGIQLIPLLQRTHSEAVENTPKLML